MQKSISQSVHVLLLLLLLLLVPVEEAKLINHDNAHVGTLHWWLVHRHNFFSLTPSLIEILLII